MVETENRSEDKEKRGVQESSTKESSLLPLISSEGYNPKSSSLPLISSEGSFTKEEIEKIMREYEDLKSKMG
jgi:hypothetical protein